MRIFCIIWLFIFFIQYNYVNKDLSKIDRNKLRTNGVIVVKPDFIKNPINIFDDKGNIVRKIYYDTIELDIKITPDSGLSIREYYPDYNIIIFESNGLFSNKYEILINNSIYYIEPNQYITFQSWEEHIKNVFVSTNKKNPLRNSPYEESKIIENLDYDRTNFIVLDVCENWIRVQCDIDCEGCPDNKIVNGWIKWKDNDNLLVKLYYAC
ncbi:MAG: hypothetical protein LBM25_01220 [Bacteroidales bacterium]|jgi:hypothetical protein|nr:hypothetical protein [Bacteroidales bacterium]